MVAIAGAGAGRAAAMTRKEWYLQKLWGAAVRMRVGGVNLCCIFSYWCMLHLAGPGCEVYSKNKFWGFDFWIRCFIFFTGACYISTRFIINLTLADGVHEIISSAENTSPPAIPFPKILQFPLPCS